MRGSGDPKLVCEWWGVLGGTSRNLGLRLSRERDPDLSRSSRDLSRRDFSNLSSCRSLVLSRSRDLLFRVLSRRFNLRGSRRGVSRCGRKFDLSECGRNLGLSGSGRHLDLRGGVGDVRSPGR